MAQFNPSNERAKRAYVEHLKYGDRRSETTIRGVETALRRFEENTGFADFATFDRRQAMAFRDALAKPPAGRKPLGPATILSTLAALQRFFGWLMLQPGMRRRIKPTDLDYLNLSAKDARAAAASPSKRFPTMEQLKRALAALPAGTDIERRDRAVFALIMLTGARDNAVASLRLRHVDLDRKLIVQDPATVRTKASKLIESVLLPLGEEVERAFTDWFAWLRDDIGYGPDDPVFPQTETRIDPDRGPVADRLRPAVWSSAAPIRAIFQRAFAAAGLPYFSPHRVRDSIVEFAYRTCRNPEELKAFSQNLGHANVATTLLSYGKIPLTRQMELIRNAGKGEDREAKLDRLFELVERKLG